MNCCASPWSFIAIAVATLLIIVPYAAAETECTALFDRLDEIEMSGGQAQGEEALDNVRGMYQSLGCSSVPTDPACRDLSAQIRSMQASGLGNSGLSRERKTIMARLRSLGCMSGSGRDQWQQDTQGARNPEVFEDLYREGGNPQDIWRSTPGSSNINNDGETLMPMQSGGRFRTLCVRSCDGFYWPISFSTRSNNFVRDQELCAASCPGQEVHLYVHRNPGEWSDQAKTPEGDPLAALANAFVFRKRFVKDCSCRGLQQEMEAASGADLPQKQEPVKAPEESFEQKLQPRNLPPQQDSDQADVYRSVPVIIAPGPGGNAEKTTEPNGLRGVSP